MLIVLNSLFSPLLYALVADVDASMTLSAFVHRSAARTSHQTDEAGHYCWPHQAHVDMNQSASPANLA